MSKWISEKERQDYYARNYGFKSRKDMLRKEKLKKQIIIKSTSSLFDEELC